VGEADEECVNELAEEELRRLLDEIAKEPGDCRLFFEFLAHSGLRIGEAIALRWQDIDLGRRRVRVRRRFYRDGFAPPKSKYGRRDVPLSHGMAQALTVTRSSSSPRSAVG
jgi:integrase